MAEDDGSGVHRIIKYQGPAKRATVAAQVFGFISIILLLAWLLHYREGIELNSDNGFRIFNVDCFSKFSFGRFNSYAFFKSVSPFFSLQVHPFLMFFGFIFLAGQAMMVYKTVNVERKVQKLVHLSCHLIAIVLGIVGLHAVFKFHDKLHIPNMYSLHSWIGIGTFSLFCLQWVAGLAVFLLPGAAMETRAKVSPWHVCGGRVLLFMAITAALTGLMEKATFMRLQHQSETRLVNFLAIAILLFGISVDLSVSLGRYA